MAEISAVKGDTDSNCVYRYLDAYTNNARMKVLADVARRFLPAEKRELALAGPARSQPGTSLPFSLSLPPIRPPSFSLSLSAQLQRARQ